MSRILKISEGKMALVNLQQEKCNIKIKYKMNVTYGRLPFFVLLRKIMAFSLVVVL